MKKNHEDVYTEPEYTEDEYAIEDGEYSGEEYIEAEDAQYAEDGQYEGEIYYADEAYEEGEYVDGEYADGEYVEGEYEGDFCEEGEYIDGEYADGEYVEGEYYEDGQYYEGEQYYEDGQYQEEYYEQDYAVDGEETDLVFEDALPIQPKPRRKKKKGGLLGAFARMSGMDKLITTTGVLVLVLALVVGSLYVSANGARQQVSSFDAVGQQLAYIESYIGEAGLLAVADAEQARIDAANALEEEEENDFWDEYDEEDYVNEVVVKMNLTTIQKDLKIKFVNKKSGKLIGNVPFQVKVEAPSGNEQTLTDDDMDGVIYLKDIDAGKYTVTMLELTDEKYEKYDISTVGKTVNVKDEIQYEKVDVADEVKDESEVNAKEEDTAQKEEIKVESELKDTVTWVESTKSQVYEAVKKSDIKDPAATAAVVSLFRRLTEGETGGVNPSTESPSTEEDPVTEQEPTPSIDAISISPGSMSLEVGGTGSFSANVTCTGTIDTSVTWTSSNPGVAEVSGGSVTAKAVGDATITVASVADPSKTATATVSVTAPAVVQATGVSLNQTSITMNAGESADLTATVSPDNTTDKTVTWSSSSADVTVTNGKITASANITTQITATITATCGTASATCAVTVNPVVSEIAVSNISLDKTSANIAVKETVTLVATVTPADATDPTVTWSSSDESVATVKNGVVTGKGVGTASITAKAGDKTATCSVTVTAATITGITLNKTSAELVLGTNEATTTLTATLAPEGASGTVEWSSSDATVASVDNTGKVTALKAGSATITAKVGEISATCTVTVKETVVITLSSETLALDLVTVKTGTLTATVTGTETKAVAWSSSNTAIATVDASGKVTAVAVGEAVITATSAADPKVKATCTVKVSATNATLITLDKATAVTYEKGTFKLVATTTPADLPVVWKSSNTAVATVAADGTVTGVKEGKADIVASVEQADGTLLTAKCSVTVNNLMKLDRTTLSMVAGASVTVNVILGDDGKGTIRAFSANPNALKVEVKDKTVVFTALAMNPSVGVTVNYTREDGVKDAQDIYVSITDNATKLTDKNGKQLFVLGADGKYVEASVSDYYKYDTFYVQTTRYTGWQTINGKVFFFNVDGKYVTGEQVIQGAKYTFASDGSLVTGDGVFGIDVSKWNGTIDWTAVKNSGVSYVIIRCGYRGSSKGALIEDPKFEKNIKGATAAGLKVGVYFFTQAVNEVEAVEEASMVLGLIKNYKISYPVFLDVESSGGRADGLDSATRTKVIKAFCETIENSGYTAGVYANKSWFEKKMDVSQLTKYKIWLAQYAASPTYTKSKIDLWQYKSTGKVSGISGNVDLNISYLGY